MANLIVLGLALMKLTSRFRFFLRLFAVAACCTLLAACGFHLRGPRVLPFNSIYLQLDPYSDFAAAVKRQILTSGSTAVATKPEDAEVIMQVTRNDRDKHILSLNSAGTVREYQLRQHFAFRIVGKDGHEITPLSEIYVFRDVSFNDAQTLAKEQEEQMLYRDMESDLVQQLMRRLAATRL